MKFTAANGSAPRVAMYLRCYPRDIWQLTTHQDALADYARELGVPEPIVFMDNGFSSRVPLPALGSLVSSVESGVYDVVLVVGLFAFSLDGGSACKVVQRLQVPAARWWRYRPPTRRSQLIPLLPESALRGGNGLAGRSRWPTVARRWSV